MNESSNMPISGDMPVAPEPFYKVWIKALTKPNENTFAELAASPQAKQTTAFLWVFIGYLVNAILSSLVQPATMRPMLEQLGVDADMYLSNGFGQTLLTAICGAPVAAVIGTVFFAIGVYIFHWIAKMFGGKGTPDQLAYALAAILAPFYLISSVFTLLSAIPYIGLCFSLIILLALVYVIVLEVMAVKGVHQISWGGAVATILIPVAVVLLFCICLVVVLVAVLVPVTSEVFGAVLFVI